MAKIPRFGQRNWRFSDDGKKFDGHRKPLRHSNLKPISPALKRGVIRCNRCGSRVVSNVDNCPFCGRSLRPFYARFWFWLIMAIVVAAVVILLVNLNLPEESTAPSGPTEPERPQIANSPEGSSLKNLALQTTIDNSGLEVTVSSVSYGSITTSRAQIYVVEVQFYNTTDQEVVLYSTQWMLENSEGERLETFVGTTMDETVVTSNFEATQLSPKGRFTGYLYFAIAQLDSEEADTEDEDVSVEITPSRVVYQPSALAYREDLLVTWKVP